MLVAALGIQDQDELIHQGIGHPQQFAVAAKLAEARESGVALSANGYILWPRVRGYTLSGTTLTLRVRPIIGPALPMTAEVQGSPERQALRQELERHIPAAA